MKLQGESATERGRFHGGRSDYDRYSYARPAAIGWLQEQGSYWIDYQMAGDLMHGSVATHIEDLNDRKAR
jgi:hypothetical protein